MRKIYRTSLHGKFSIPKITREICKIGDPHKDFFNHCNLWLIKISVSHQSLFWSLKNILVTFSMFGPVFELGFSELTIFILAFGPKSTYWCGNLIIFKLVFA